MKKKVSLKDIAEEVGVSIALVSYVLNNQKEGRINKEVAAKIRHTATSMNYRANQIARSLKTNKTHTIGLIIADISNPFFSGLARTIEDEADKNNYTVIFGSSHEDAEKFSKLVDTLVNRQVDGLMISPPEGSEIQIKYLQDQGIPFVLLDRYFPSVKTNYVVLDNYEAAHHAVKYLALQGRKTIGMITYQSELFHLKDRRLGYLSALAETAIPFNESWLKEVNINHDKTEIETAVKELLLVQPSIDAILFASNSIANYAVKYINTLGLKVPESLALVSFDEPESLDLFYAPLTYLQQPVEEMAQKATEILLNNIQQKSKGEEQVSIKAKLVIRKSA